MTLKHYANEQKIYWDIEPHMLYDYVNFANRLREVQAMDERYKEYDMIRDGKRWFLILFTEVYQKSLEDLGVMLLALRRRFNKDSSCKYQKKFSVDSTPVTFTQINYVAGEASIKNALDVFPAQRDFIEGLRINDLGNINIEFIRPGIVVQDFYSNLYKNLVDWAQDQEKRFSMYNKIKHGPSIVGSARIFNSKNKNAPAVVYVDHDTNLKDHPLIVHTFHFTEEEFELLRRGVLKVGECIRDLISIYMCKNYSDFLKSKGFSSPLLFFDERRPGEKNI